MAVQPDAIKLRLRALFPKANLSKTRIDAIAAKLATKPADDADDAAIDEVINDFNDGPMSIEDIAKLDDKLRTLESKPTPAPAPNPVPPVVDEDPIKQLLNEFKTLKEELANIKAGETKKTITERFNSDPRVKDVPDFIRKGYIPTSEDDFEANVEALTGSYKEFAEKNKLSTQGGDQPAAGGTPKKAGQVKMLTKEEAEQIVKSMN